MTGVYDVLSNDPTWDRANQIIQLFDNAPVVEESPNDPLTLENELKSPWDRMTLEGWGEEGPYKAYGPELLEKGE